MPHIKAMCNVKASFTPTLVSHPIFFSRSAFLLFKYIVIISGNTKIDN